MHAVNDAGTTGDVPTEDTAGIVGIARGGGLNLVGAAFNQFVRFAITYALARVLGRSQSGLYFQAYAILSLLGVLASFGFTQSLTRFVALYRAEENGAALRGVVRLALVVAAGTAALMGAALFAASPYIAREIFHEPSLILLLRFVSVALPSTVYTDCALAATQGFKTMRPYARINLFFEPALNAVLTVTLLVLGLGLKGAMAALTITNVIASVLAAIALQRLLRRYREPPEYEARRLLSFTVVSWGSQLTAIGLLWADTILLGIMRTSAAVGLYQVATRLTILMTTVIAPIGLAFAPRVADLYRRGELEALRHAYAVVTSWIFRLALPAAVVLIVFARQLLGLFGPGFESGATVTVVLTVGQLVNAITGPCGLMLVMSGRPGIQLAGNAATLALNLGLNLYLIPRYGVVGAAIAWAISMIFINALRVVAVAVTMHMLPLHEGLLKGALAGGVAAVAGFAARQFTSGPLTLLLGVPLTVVVYALTLLLLGVGTEDRLVLESLRARVRAGARA
jgi:O-antigen/teichoic acid export membrane protein